MDILSFRRRFGLTQMAFASKIGVSHSTVAQWETGRKYPSYDVLKRLFLLGATLEEVFGIDCRKTCPHALGDADFPLTRAEVLDLIDQRMGAARKQAG